MAAEYGQSCPAARTLELVGDRWTLLLVRDLGPAPRRFAELRAGLPGLAPNLLTERLRRLVGAGIVSRRAQSSRNVVYALTPVGRELLPVVVGLFGWGRRHLGAPVALRHRACGTEVEVTVWCPCCARPIRREDCDRVPDPEASPADR